ncbi:fumarate hydratase [Candidatus Bathyarchaeota archaeon]|nr:fumarate hydratase [Candidatus Bathyarchaeota archaeon]
MEKIFKLDEEDEYYVPFSRLAENLDLRNLIEKLTVNLLRLAVTELPADVKKALKDAYRKERNPIGKIQLKAILENIQLAEEERIPICQDTGLISFYVKVGSEFRGLSKIEEALIEGVKRATVEIPLRPNAVNPFTQRNTDNNTGRHVPCIHWSIIDGNYLEITAFPKGGGSENMCALRILKPAEGLSGLKRFIIESVVNAGGMPCPPTIIGVGVGGTSDMAMNLAKKALLRPINKSHSDPFIAELERDLLRAVNSTGVGPMGLGGDSTALALKIEYAHRHPASYPVAIAFQCWAARRATARVYSDGRVECLSHKDRNLV